MDLRRLIQGAATSERMRRRMALRGVTPNGHPLWNRFETGTLRLRHPDYRAALIEIVRRTRPAAYGKASRMGITKPRAPVWGDSEILGLRIYRSGTKAEILAAFPSRSYSAVGRKANSRGIYRQRPAPNAGIKLVDQILQRARGRNYSLAELDAEIKSGGYFAKRKWKAGELRTALCARAVTLLGGSVKIRWRVVDINER